LAATLESLNYWLSLLLAPILVVLLALLAAYLGGLKVVHAPRHSQQGEGLSRWMLELTYRRRIFEVVLDFFLICIAYYLAFLTRYGLSMDAAKLELYLQSLPLALASTYLSFYAFGVYRGVWRYVGVSDLVRYFQAALGSLALLASSIFLIDRLDLVNWTSLYSHIVVLLFGAFLFLFLASSRSSFKALDRLAYKRVREDDERVLIYGAGDAGEMALRWILMNPEIKFRPVGFLDDDPFMAGRQIHGVEVLGGWEQLEAILQRHQVEGVILASQDVIESSPGELAAACQKYGCWVRALRLEFEALQ
jgi:UDP-GlcNAc:undecaprenyl-phosphate GlcNAc-1-phosphate transferase